MLALSSRSSGHDSSSSDRPEITAWTVRPVGRVDSRDRPKSTVLSSSGRNEGVDDGADLDLDPDLALVPARFLYSGEPGEARGALKEGEADPRTRSWSSSCSARCPALPRSTNATSAASNALSWSTLTYSPAPPRLPEETCAWASSTKNPDPVFAVDPDPDLVPCGPLGVVSPSDQDCLQDEADWTRGWAWIVDPDEEDSELDLDLTSVGPP